MSIRSSIRRYTSFAPRVFAVQVVTDFVLFGFTYLLNMIANWALASQGRVAVTTGDFAFLFTSWQGIVLIVSAIVMFYIAVGLDINAMVALTGHWLRGEDVSPVGILRDGLYAMRKYICPWGALVVFYIVLLAPIVGSNLSISMTRGLYVPDFITSVIFSNGLYTLLYLIALAVFGAIGFFGMFVIHGVVLDGLEVEDSIQQSLKLTHEHWADYTIKTALFSIALLACFAIIIMLLGIVAGVGSYLIYRTGWVDDRFITIFVISCFGCIGFTLLSLSSSFSMVKMTERYLTYTDGFPEEEVVHPRKHHPLIALFTIVVMGFITIVSYVGSKDFDTMFPQGSDVHIIAHRACGSEGVENSAAGLDIAAEAGAWGAEIDIQRTSDGYYVVNHDDTFERVAGDSRAPSEMTLAEVKKLTIKNTADPSAPGEPVPTYEEMLEGSRDKVILFVELKGATADKQMADDAVRIAKEYDMLDQCVFISLKYRLIDYLEDTYPDVQTGFLAFASYGNTAGLNTDYLALERETMTLNTISAIHEQGKKALVWTVNDKDTQYEYLLSNVDGIITDEVSQAEASREEIAQRDDVTRIIDKARYIFFGE